MFTQEDIDIIDSEYFKVLSASGHCVTLYSKCSGHYWHIIHQDYSNFKSCQIWHKHNFSDAFHAHRNQPTLQKAISEIKEHDNYHINVRLSKKKKCRKKQHNK